MTPRTQISVIGMDIEQARCNMVEQQIRTWEVLDPDVLDLLFVVRREDFVPAACRLLAFADLEIPLGSGAKMWSPRMEARVLQELRLVPGESVLEIGTGSGYLTALLASRGARVTSVEIDPQLAADAKARLAHLGTFALRAPEFALGAARRADLKTFALRAPEFALGATRRADLKTFALRAPEFALGAARRAHAGIGSVELATGDGARGWGDVTYDAIVLTGSTPVLPDRFTQQLNPGGRIFVVVGEPPAMSAQLVRWVAPGVLTERILFETMLEPLTNAVAPAHFEF